MNKLYRAIGMISGTSIDGIDTALIETDGYDYVRPLAFMPYSYNADFRERLRGCFGNKDGAQDPKIAAFEQELTELHAALVRQFLAENNLQADDIDLLGFHGQTIWHRPEERVTVQIGDGALLASLTGIPVVNDFRSADVKAGGHGAPLVPLYHRALAADLPKPVAIINIGGVSNITWIGAAGESDVLAFDMGPGNALIDDWVLRHTGQAYDEYGLLAGSGSVDEESIQRFMQHEYFAVMPPKSLDRDAWRDLTPSTLNVADGAATLTMMTAKAIAEGLRHAPVAPHKLYLTGGGRHNLTLMKWIGELSGLPVDSVDILGWSGDGLEAEAFGYLAVRSVLGEPLSLPGTTGVKEPMHGGQFHEPPLSEKRGLLAEG